MDSPSRKSTEEKQIPHSGNLGLEKPQVIFDKTTLPEALRGPLTDDRGDIIVPDSPAGLAEKEAPKKKRRGLIAGVAIGATAAVAGAALAFGTLLPKGDTTTEPGPETDPNNSGQVVEDPEGEVTTPEETGIEGQEWYIEETSATELGPMPAELAPYAAMTDDEYYALPKAEQWKLSSWLTQHRGAFMDVFYKYSGNVAANKPIELTMDSGAQDILSAHATTVRQSYTLVEGTPNFQENGPTGVLDENLVSKLNIAANITRIEADAQTNLIATASEGQALSVAMVGAGGGFDISNLEITSDTATDDTFEGIAAKKHTITYLDSSGTERGMVAYVYTVTDFNNQPLLVTSVDFGGVQ